MGDRNGTLVPLTAAEVDVLRACSQAITRQQEMLTLLAGELGLPEGEVFYAWARRQIRQRWQLGGTGWRAYFHGIECDLTHDDGRRVRLDFGPGGRVDTCNSWGVYLVASTTRLFSGGQAEFEAAWNQLVVREAFQPADESLLALQARYTTTGPGGIQYVRFPDDIPERTRLDCSVAHRTILSPVGLRLLESARAARYPAA